MQKIAIEAIGLQPLQRSFAGGDGAAPRCVARQHFRDKKKSVTFSGDRIRDHELRIAIHLGGVDMGHAEIDAAFECRDSTLAVAAIEIPGALPDHGYVGAVSAEFLCTQVSPRSTLVPPTPTNPAR